MAKVADISTKLSLNNRDFKKGLQATSKSIGKFHAAFKNAAGKIAKAGAFALAAAGVAMVAIVKKTADEIDSLSKQARKLNITTEMLAGLGHAAKLSGLDSEKLGKSLIKMTKAVSEANQGLSTQVRAFEDLGLEVDDLMAMDAGEQFMAVADALQKVEIHSDKVRVAMDIFGRTGGDLLVTMEQGAGGIRRAIKEAEHLGITFKDEQGAMVEEANDAMTKLGAIAKGAFNQITIAIAPFVTKWADSMTDMSLSGESMADRVAGAMRSIISGMGFVMEKVISVRGAFRKLASESLEVWSDIQHLWELPGEQAAMSFQELARHQLPEAFGEPLGAKGVGDLGGVLGEGKAIERLRTQDPDAYAKLVGEITAGQMKPSEISMAASKALELGAGQDWGAGGQAALLAKFDAAIAETNKRVAEGAARRAAEAAEKAGKILEMRIGAGAGIGPMTEQQLAEHLAEVMIPEIPVVQPGAVKKVAAAVKPGADQKMVDDVVAELKEANAEVTDAFEGMGWQLEMKRDEAARRARFDPIQRLANLVDLYEEGVREFDKPAKNREDLRFRRYSRLSGTEYRFRARKRKEELEKQLAAAQEKADKRKDKDVAIEMDKGKVLLAILNSVNSIRDGKFVSFAS